MSSETAKGLSASIQQAGVAIANKAEEAQDPETPLGARLQKGWGSVLEATKQAVDATREVVEKEQSRLFATAPVYIRRDPRLPLDVDALRDAEVVYITERIITMSHPALQSPIDEKITPNRKLAAVAHLLERRHGGRYMVWNLSEVEYDVDMLDDQVLTFSFPGSPSPPLGLLLKLIISMESWLKADERNVAVVHCLTGKGRTSTVLAAFLCWIGEAGFHNVQEALTYIADCKKLSEEELTIPSQRRYVKYFANMLDGVRPSQPPLMLKRVIMSEAPKVLCFAVRIVVLCTVVNDILTIYFLLLQFAKGPPLPGEETLDDDSLMGCAPYIQIFKAGQLLFTAAASVNYQQDKQDLPFCHVAAGSISFSLDQVVQGDILVRCRHLTASGQRVSMFRAAFHTGYVPPQVMRLAKGQLDGACNDKRFSDDFYLDLIFEPCNAEMASQHLNTGKPTAESEEGDTEKKEMVDTKNETEVQGGVTVTASAYDSMLHRDSRFWDVIAARREEHTSNQHAQEEDPMWGPTIGRKRDLTSTSKGFAEKTQGKPKDQSSSLQAFSIGGDLDFFDTVESPAPKKSEPKRDELMEALMALDDDPVSPSIFQGPSAYGEISETPLHDGIEEIVFEAREEPALVAEEPHATIVELPPPKKAEAVPATTMTTEEKPAEDAKSEEKVESQEPPVESAVAPATTTTTSAADEAADLLKDADLDMDADLDALLAAGDEEDGDLADDMGDLDFDDDDLEDLENLLSAAKK